MFKSSLKVSFNMFKVRIMNTERDQRQTIQPSSLLWKLARHGLEFRGTTMTRWCEQNGIDRRNAWRAVTGQRDGAKARLLRDRILKEAGVIDGG